MQSWHIRHMDSFRAIVEKELARRGSSAIREALAAGLGRDAIRSVLRGRTPSVNRAFEICEALDLEFYIGPQRPPAEPDGLPAPQARPLSHIRDRRLAEVLTLIVAHWQALGNEYARSDFVARLYDREPGLRDAADRRRGQYHSLPSQALEAVSEHLQGLGNAAPDRGIDPSQLKASLRELGVDPEHPIHAELDRLDGEQSHAVICQAFLRAGVWLDVHIRGPGESRPVGAMEWRRRNYRVVYSADLAHAGARLENGWVLMLGGDIDRLIAEGLLTGQARARHIPCEETVPAALVAKLVWEPPTPEPDAP